ncbi:addiction module antitoxin RelB [Candidatus Campbellbacteria bacterium]|nr:MAG: addiction module antitoxin RelB [Candidatus Campbellbacteria bacterium]
MFQIYYHSQVKNDLKKISKTEKTKIKKAIENKLSVDPVVFGNFLKNTLSGYRKLKVGKYRIVYQVTNKKEILIIIISHRKDVYSHVLKRV